MSQLGYLGNSNDFQSRVAKRRQKNSGGNGSRGVTPGTSSSGGGSGSGSGSGAADPEMARIYHPGSLSSRLVDSYVTQVEMLIKVITELFRTASQREILAKKLKEAMALKAELLALKESKEKTLAFLKAEMKRCGRRESLDINDIYNREASLCSTKQHLNIVFDIKTLAKEYIRVHGSDKATAKSQ